MNSILRFAATVALGGGLIGSALCQAQDQSVLFAPTAVFRGAAYRGTDCLRINRKALPGRAINGFFSPWKDTLSLIGSLSSASAGDEGQATIAVWRANTKQKIGRAIAACHRSAKKTSAGPGPIFVSAAVPASDGMQSAVFRSTELPLEVAIDGAPLARETFQFVADNNSTNHDYTFYFTPSASTKAGTHRLQVLTASGTATLDFSVQGDEPPPSVHARNDALPPDVNQDGKVDKTDSLLLNALLSGATTSDAARKASLLGDINGDGIVSTTDLLQLVNFLFLTK